MDHVFSPPLPGFSRKLTYVWSQFLLRSIQFGNILIDGICLPNLEEQGLRPSFKWNYISNVDNFLIWTPLKLNHAIYSLLTTICTIESLIWDIYFLEGIYFGAKIIVCHLVYVIWFCSIFTCSILQSIFGFPHIDCLPICLKSIVWYHVSSKHQLNWCSFFRSRIWAINSLSYTE